MLVFGTASSLMLGGVIAAGILNGFSVAMMMSFGGGSEAKALSPVMCRRLDREV